MFDAPLNAVVMTRLKSSLTLDPSEKVSLSGTTVHPSRTPVKTAYFEKELHSMATSLAPSISKMLLGTPAKEEDGVQRWRREGGRSMTLASRRRRVEEDSGIN